MQVTENQRKNLEFMCDHNLKAGLDGSLYCINGTGTNCRLHKLSFEALKRKGFLKLREKFYHHDIKKLFVVRRGREFFHFQIDVPQYTESLDDCLKFEKETDALKMAKKLAANVKEDHHVEPQYFR